MSVTVAQKEKRSTESRWLREYRKQIAREMAEAKKKAPKAIENIPTDSGDQQEPSILEEEKAA